MQQRLSSLRPEPIAFGHRGAKAHSPENTLESFGLALRLGANGLETDAWMTKDGVVVLDHDGVVRVRGRKRSITEVTFSQLPDHIPSLGQLFESCGRDYDLSIDVKDDAVADGIVREARDAQFDLSRLWLCHYKLELTLSYRQKFPDVRIVDSTRLARLKDGPEMRAALLADKGVDVLNMHITDWNGGLVTLLHRFQVLAFGWDIQFPHALNNALRMGLDGIYSDYVDRMVDAYVEEIGHSPIC